MKLICPSCGAVASAECWENDNKIREAFAAALSLPYPVTLHVLPYLSLFRPEQRSLTWVKALRLIIEVKDLVDKGYVKQQGRVDRTCPPSIWAKAMEQMVERRASLRLPLDGHNYLRKVAYDLADQADYQSEKKQTVTVQQNRAQRPARSMECFDPDKARDEYQRQMQADREEAAMPDFMKDIIKGIK